MFPQGRTLPPDTVGELRSMLSYNMFGKSPSALVMVSHENTL